MFGRDQHCSCGVRWSAWVFLFGWWWCLEFCRRTVHWPNSTISCPKTNDVTFRTGHPSPAFLSDELPATDSLVPRTLPRLSPLTQADYTIPVTPRPFSEAMVNPFQKIQQELQIPPVGKSHRFASVPRSREALYSPLELYSTGFLISWDCPVVDKGFTEPD